MIKENSIEVSLKESTPSTYLFYGVCKDKVQSVIENGIEKVNSKYVNLYSDLEMILSLGNKEGETSIFLVDTFSMIKEGFKFNLSHNNVWLIDYVPSQYLTLLDKKFINRNKKLVNISKELKEEFLDELFKVYKRFGVSISHEDQEGGFLLEKFNEKNIKIMSEINDLNNELKFL